MKDRRVWIILLVALGLRMVLLHCAFTDCRGALPPASSKYDSLAFFMGDPRWSYEDSVARSPDSHVKIVPEIQVPPGYPALCFAANWVAEQIPEADDSAYADDHNRASRSQQIVISFQVLVDLHLVLLTFLLGRALAGHTAGLVAELFQALSPLAAAASVRLLPDGILAFLLTASVILMIRHFRTGGWVSLLTAGLLVSGASYFQPVGLVLAGVMIAVLLFRVKRFRRTAAFAGVVAVCIGPWVMRNVTQAGYWGFSSFLTDDLYRFSAAEIEARRQGEPVWRIRKHRFEQEGWLEWGNSKPKYPDAPCYLSPGGLAGYRWRKTREIIAEHPGDFVDLHMRGNLAFWLPGATDVLEVAGLTYGGRTSCTATAWSKRRRTTSATIQVTLSRRGPRRWPA